MFTATKDILEKLKGLMLDMVADTRVLRLIDTLFPEPEVLLLSSVFFLRAAPTYTIFFKVLFRKEPPVDSFFNFSDLGSPRLKHLISKTSAITVIPMVRMCFTFSKRVCLF